MKKTLLLTLASVFLGACSIAQIQEGEQYTGTSMDLLQDGQDINARLVDGKLEIMISAKGEKCKGHFQYVDSDKSWLGFTTASNNYVGTFSGKFGKACQKAVGTAPGTKIAVQIARMGGLLGTSMMSSTAIRICSDAEGVCVPKNTFKVEKS